MGKVANSEKPIWVDVLAWRRAEMQSDLLGSGEGGLPADPMCLISKPFDQP